MAPTLAILGLFGLAVRSRIWSVSILSCLRLDRLPIILPAVTTCPSFSFSHYMHKNMVCYFAQKQSTTKMDIIDLERNIAKKITWKVR